MIKISSEDFMKAVGLAFRRARIKKGLTQATVGENANKPKNIASKIEKSPPKDLALRVLFELCSKNGMSLGGIISEVEEDLGVKKGQSLEASNLNIAEEWETIEKNVRKLPLQEQVQISNIIWEVLKLKNGN